MMSKTLGIVFSNMHDSMLGQLTENRTMASVPFGGRYRLIDFVLSNLINSGIKDVGIITKSNFQSLMDHVGNGKEWDHYSRCLRKKRCEGAQTGRNGNG